MNTASINFDRKFIVAAVKSAGYVQKSPSVFVKGNKKIVLINAGAGKVRVTMQAVEEHARGRKVDPDATIARIVIEYSDQVKDTVLRLAREVAREKIRESGFSRRAVKNAALGKQVA